MVQQSKHDQGIGALVIQNKSVAGHNWYFQSLKFYGDPLPSNTDLITLLNNWSCS